MAGLSIIEETKIVALMARGDNYTEIQKELMDSLGKHVSKVTLSKVRARNKENLALIAQRVMEKEEADALAIKNKANNIIKKKLDSEDKTEAIITKAKADYLDGEITIKEYMEVVKFHRPTGLTELVGVSKEMHNQAGTVPDKPVSSEDMAKLAAAIQSGDEVTLNQMVFKRGQPSDTEESSIQPSPAS